MRHTLTQRLEGRCVRGAVAGSVRVPARLRLVTLVLLAMCCVPAAVAAGSATLDAAVACRKAISKKGRTYADKRRRLLLGCVDKLLKCDLQDEIDGINPNSCRSRATDSCTRRVGSAPDSGLNTVATAFHDKAMLTCLPFGVGSMCSTGAGGLWFGNDPVCGASNSATCGGSADLATLIDCLRGEMEVQVDGTVGRMKPRAGLLLDNVGLGSGFPNLPRPPFVSVVVSATGVGSGVLVNPGTITINSSEALKFSGDATTLPCSGSGMNGRLTISVGTGTACNDPNAQVVVIKEPYGSANIAVFGPYTSNQNYCIELKDGSCMDTATGVISVM